MELSQLFKKIISTEKESTSLFDLLFGKIGVSPPKTSQATPSTPLWKQVLGKGVDATALKKWSLKFKPYEFIALGSSYAAPTKESARPVSLIEPTLPPIYIPTPSPRVETPIEIRIPELWPTPTPTVYTPSPVLPSGKAIAPTPTTTLSGLSYIQHAVPFAGKTESGLSYIQTPAPFKRK